MSTKRLEEQNFSLIKQHIIDPENSQLSPELQEHLDRLLTAAKLTEKNPIKKHAVALHQRRYPNISMHTAYRDLRDAAKLYNTYHTFDWDFWQNWLLEDITKNINDARKTGTAQDRKIITAEHANLLKVIGDKPSDIDDPTRHEKNQFVIVVNLDGNKTQIDLENLDKMPTQSINELNKILFSGHEIEDAKIEEIFEDND